MPSELEQLQERVAVLEAALAAAAVQGRPPSPRGRMAVAGMLCAGAVVVGLPATLATRAGTMQGAQGPMKVTAPFEVVDDKGRTIFKVQMSASGAGLGIFYDDGGQEVAIIGHARGSQQGVIRVQDKGIDKVVLGISGKDGLIQVGNDVDPRIKLFSGDTASISFLNPAGGRAVRIFRSSTGDGGIDLATGGKNRVELGISKAGDAGLLTLYSNKSKAQTVLHADAGLQQKNAMGVPVAQLYVDDNGHGSVMVASRAGSFMSKLTIALDGSSGRVEVSGGGELKALMGVLTNGKGDVCANGDKASACLSQVNPRY